MRIRKFLSYWNPFRTKFYVYVEGKRDSDQKTIIRAKTRFEGAWASPGKKYYWAKYLEPHMIPTLNEMDTRPSLKERFLGTHSI